MKQAIPHYQYFLCLHSLFLYIFFCSMSKLLEATSPISPSESFVSAAETTDTSEENQSTVTQMEPKYPLKIILKWIIKIINL